jgi:hypothetical protein
MDFLIAPNENPDPMGAMIVEKDMPNPFQGGYYSLVTWFGIFP